MKIFGVAESTFYGLDSQGVFRAEHERTRQHPPKSRSDEWIGGFFGCRTGGLQLRGSRDGRAMLHRDNDSTAEVPCCCIAICAAKRLELVEKFKSFETFEFLSCRELAPQCVTSIGHTPRGLVRCSEIVKPTRCVVYEVSVLASAKVGHGEERIVGIER